MIRRVDTNWVERLRKVKGFVSYHVEFLGMREGRVVVHEGP